MIVKIVATPKILSELTKEGGFIFEELDRYKVCGVELVEVEIRLDLLKVNIVDFKDMFYMPDKFNGDLINVGFIDYLNEC